MTATRFPAAPPPPDERVIDETIVGDRFCGWVASTEITCPRHHHIKDGALHAGEAPMRCHYREYAGGRECGILMWGIHNLRANISFVAEVEWADLDVIKQHTSVLQTLKYLGAPLLPRIVRRHGASPPPSR